MTRAFLDTTVLCDALGFSAQGNFEAAKTAISEYEVSEVPYYGLRELRAGVVSYYLLAHNMSTAESSISAALTRLNKASSFRPRQNVGSMAAITGALTAVLEQASTGQLGQGFDAKKEVENCLARKILTSWAKRKSVVTRFVQPLSCFSDKDLEFSGDQLVFPGGADCTKGAGCGAAYELKSKPQAVVQLIDALKPPKNQEGAKEKKETTRRRAALKDISLKAAKEFPRRNCRAIGDAYFCIMAPTDAAILTTNASDFSEMASVLGKNLKIVVP